MNRKMISAVMASMMLVGNIPVVFASDVQADTKGVDVNVTESVKAVQGDVTVTNYTLHTLDNYDEYKDVFEVKPISYKNNAGNFGTSVLSQAFDDNLGTYWETNSPNKGAFKNEVTVEFENVEEISRIIYSSRKDAGNKGHVTEFSIYGSTTETGNDFELVASGKANRSSGLTEIKFKPTEFKRLKFVFDKVYNDWASIGELQFLKDDVVLNEIDNVFTDGLMMELSDKYKDATVRDAFLTKLKAHPLSESYSEVINLVERLANGEVISEESVTTLQQKGHEVSERDRTKLTFAQFAHEPTGVVLRQGETLKVYVDADENGVMPEIVFHLSHFVKLKPGYNEITLPANIKGPVQVYYANRAYGHQQAYKPRVRIEGGTPYPVYIHGKTDPV